MLRLLPQTAETAQLLKSRFEEAAHVAEKGADGVKGPQGNNILLGSGAPKALQSEMKWIKEPLAELIQAVAAVTGGRVVLTPVSVIGYLPGSFFSEYAGCCPHSGRQAGRQAAWQC